MTVLLPDFLVKVKQAPMFASLYYRDFRYLIVASFLASVCRWMETIVLTWLAVELTGSPLLVGVVATIRMAGYVIGPFCGIVIDRYNRRNTGMVVAGVSVVYAFVLGVLVMTAVIQYWHVVVIAAIAGLVHAFDVPLRYALTGDLVEERDLSSAFGLAAVALDLTIVLGPALGGVLIGTVGISMVCWVMMITYLLNVGAFYVIRLKPRAELREVAERSPRHNLIEGIRYIQGNHPIIALLVIAGVANALLVPVIQTLAPVLANSVLDVGVSGYGFLLAASGIGALIGALAVTSLGQYPHKAWLCIIVFAGAGVATIFFSISGSYSLCLGLIGFYGLMKGSGMTLLGIVLMLLTPAEFRGRVMGMRAFVILSAALGNTMIGAIAEMFGAPVAGISFGALNMVLILVVAVIMPSFRKSV